ncbi:unnamed protein product [Rotaria sp. Silwood1]|nr:unnamed protein product [Rotaria sp. Silwood1]
MINPTFTCSNFVDDNNDDDGISLTWSPTEDERRRIEEYKEYVRQSPAYHQSVLQYALAEEPSIVLDGFLFLGNLRHGSNLDLLDRFQIGN